MIHKRSTALERSVNNEREYSTLEIQRLKHIKNKSNCVALLHVMIKI